MCCGVRCSEMKMLSFAAVFGASVCAGVSCAAAEAGVCAPVGDDVPLLSEVSPEARPYVELLLKCAAVVERINVLQDSIRDRVSADAAAPRLGSLYRELQDLMGKARTMPEPDAEVKPQVEQVLHQVLEQPMARLIQGVMYLALNQCFESDALRELLDRLDQAGLSPS